MARDAAVAAPRTGVLHLASALSDGIKVRITNSTKRFLREVRIELQFEEDVIALEWDDPADVTEALFPERPLPWGSDSWSALIGSNNIAQFVHSASSDDGVVVVARQEPAAVSLALAALRPQQEILSNDEEVVLIRFTDTAPSEPVTGRWRLTAGDIDDVREGSFSLETVLWDWTEPIAELLAHGEETLPDQ